MLVLESTYPIIMVVIPSILVMTSFWLSSVLFKVDAIASICRTSPNCCFCARIFRVKKQEIEPISRLKVQARVEKIPNFPCKKVNIRTKFPKAIRESQNSNVAFSARIRAPTKDHNKLNHSRNTLRILHVSKKSSQHQH